MNMGTGVARQWYPNGQLQFEITTIHGIRNGRQRVWDTADNLSSDKFSYCIPIGERVLSGPMSSKTDVWQGTLALMVLKTLERKGPLHGYGIARQIEETSADLLSVNYGTLYPALLKLEQEGYITSEWGVSDNNRKAKFYQLTKAGRKQIEKETQEWEQMASILARFLNPTMA